MNERGVSPVIATVLLIGIVIALGVVVFLWFRGFTQEAVTKFNGENIQLVCSNVQFEASYSSDGSLSVSNTGNVPIYNMNVQIDNKDGTYTTQQINNLMNNWPNSGINQGGSFSGNAANVISSSTSDLVLIPILRGTTSSGQQQSYTCGSQYGYKISVS